MMTQDEIIRMAREAGFEVNYYKSLESEEVVSFYPIITYNLELFAALVAEPWIETNKALVNEIIELKKQAEQEPVAWYSDKGGFNECGEGQPLYAAPIRTKDLTDDEIAQACGWKFGQPMYEWVIGLARAVIAADREKNNV